MGIFYTQVPQRTHHDTHSHFYTACWFVVLPLLRLLPPAPRNLGDVAASFRFQNTVNSTKIHNRPGLDLEFRILLCLAQGEGTGRDNAVSWCPGPGPRNHTRGHGVGPKWPKYNGIYFKSKSEVICHGPGIAQWQRVATRSNQDEVRSTTPYYMQLNKLHNRQRTNTILHAGNLLIYTAKNM